MKMQNIAYTLFPRMIDVYSRKCRKVKGEICKTYLETYKYK
jgi:hypothetical protein